MDKKKKYVNKYRYYYDDNNNTSRIDPRTDGFGIVHCTIRTRYT